MLKRTFRKKHTEAESAFELQITSLADILIIVLVFLLNTFNFDLRGKTEFEVNKSIRLPNSIHAGGGSTDLTVEVNESEIRLDGKKTSELSNYRFQTSDLQNDLPASSSSTSLSNSFAKMRSSGTKEEAALLVVADHRVPYATIQTVLASAALHGFTNIKLAVVAKK